MFRWMWLSKKRDIIIIRLLNHENYLQRVQKYTLSPFDDKHFYESNIKKNLELKIMIFNM